MANFDPFVFKTEDYGKTWRALTKTLPRGPVNYAHCIREDPVRKGLLYLGTENALYVSLNDGVEWFPLQNNLPHAPVNWLTVQENVSDLAVATYGRGFWILDDISPLREIAPETLDAQAFLFSPRPAYRLHHVNALAVQPEDPGSGENPPEGADITYFLKSVPSGDVKISILDDKRQTVRILSGTNAAGLNRVWWNLAYESPERVRLRTLPQEHPHEVVGPIGWRPLRMFDVQPYQPLAVPGTYTVKLTVGSQEIVKKLIIKKDPNSAGTPADIQSQQAMLLNVRSDMDGVAGMINEIELIRRQLQDLDVVMQRQSGGGLKDASLKLDARLLEIEGKLVQTRLTDASEDALRWPAKLYERLLYLASDVRHADFPPTTQQVEVHETLKKDLASTQMELSGLLEKELGAFNRLLKDRNVPNIVASLKKSTASQ